MPKACLEANEVRSLENAATNMRERLLIRLLTHLGCRVSEALSLEVEDINFGQGIVITQRLKSPIQLSCPKCNARLGKSRSFCTKCGANVKTAVAKEKEHPRMRAVPLDEDTLQMPEDYIKRGDPGQTEGESESSLVLIDIGPGKL